MWRSGHFWGLFAPNNYDPNWIPLHHITHVTWHSIWHGQIICRLGHFLNNPFLVIFRLFWPFLVQKLVWPQQLWPFWDCFCTIASMHHETQYDMVKWLYLLGYLKIALFGNFKAIFTIFVFFKWGEPNFGILSMIWCPMKNYKLYNYKNYKWVLCQKPYPRAAYF